MNLERSILDAVRALPPDRQRELLKHVNELRKATVKKPRKSGRGLWAGLDVCLPAGEIDELRRELWRDFPRNDI